MRFGKFPWLIDYTITIINSNKVQNVASQNVKVVTPPFYPPVSLTGTGPKMAWGHTFLASDRRHKWFWIRFWSNKLSFVWGMELWKFSPALTFSTWPKYRRKSHNVFWNLSPRVRCTWKFWNPAFEIIFSCFRIGRDKAMYDSHCLRNPITGAIMCPELKRHKM